MSNADVAAELLAAEADLAKVTDKLTSLAGDVAKLGGTPVEDVPAVATAMGKDVTAATSSAADVQKHIDAAQAALGGQPPQPTPDLLFEYTDLAGPIELPVGTMAELRTITSVVKVPPADGKFRKIVGADSSKGKFGGLCFGITNQAKLEAWVDDGQGIQQAVLDARINKRSFATFRVLTSLTNVKIDDSSKAVNLPNGRVTCDGICAVNKGVWNHQFDSPVEAGVTWNLRGYRVELTDAQIAADAERWKDRIDPPDAGNGGGGGGPPPASGLEPPAGDATQVEVVADATERQTIQGFGAGFGPIQELDRVFPRMQQYAKTDFDDIRLKLARIIWSGDGATLGRAYAPVVKWAADRVATYGEKLWVHATWFQYKNGDPIGSAQRLAAGIKAGVDAGCQIDSVCVCNEPGGTNAHIPDGEYVPSHRELRTRLDGYGLQRIIITALEYPKDSLDPLNDNARHHYDLLKAGGCIPSVVPIGAVHCYGDCTTVELADKWGSQLGIMQLESGYGLIPRVGSRMLNDLNKNVSWWSYHLLQAFDPDKQGDYGQKLVDMNGRPNAYYHSYRILSTRFLPGTVMRRCTAGGAVPFFSEKSQSPVFVACGKRKDGKWVVAATSHGGGKRQFTFQIQGASTVNGTMTGERVNGAGAPAPYSANVVNGYVRLTVGNNEIAALVGP